jgi:S1-C subfamily serine protease
VRPVRPSGRGEATGAPHDPSDGNGHEDPELLATPPPGDAAPLRRRPARPPWLAAFSIGLSLVAIALGALSLSRIDDLRAEQRSADAQLESAVEERLDRLDARNARLDAVVAKLGGRLAESDAGIAPLATRILRSVYTIETDESGGTAWVAWERGGSSYLITADHVTSGYDDVTILKGTRRWPGRVVRSDEVNDMALVRVDAELGPPLWSDPRIKPTPDVGDELVLIGSPYGLEGTVTSGVVSRVTYNRVQTDAAANPGNSGGPAVDRAGRVVGVLVEGGGENLNFAVPISRACVRIRSC